MAHDRRVRGKTTKAALALAQALVLLCGCGEDDPTAPKAVCAQVDGECVGVPLEPICADSACTGGVACTQVLGASSDAELASRISEAAPGDCIALSPGSYTAADLPGGVSLLGRSASEVHVGSVRLGDGTGAWVRGIEIAGGGLDAGAAKDARVDAVVISGGEIGLRAGPGAVVHMSRSEVRDSALYGVTGADATVTIDHSLVVTTDGPGVWLQCGDGTDGCGCTSKPTAALDHVRVQQHAIVGVSLIGVEAKLSHVDIVEGRGGPNFTPTGGLSASGCSKLSYDDLFVQGMSSYGVLVHQSSAGPVGDLEAAGIIVVDGKPGIWVQSIGTSMQEPNQTVELVKVEASSCSVAGIGFDLGARGIIVVDGKVSNTRAEQWPVEVDMVSKGQASVGLGLVWKAGSAAQIDGLDVTGSAGLGVVIDGPVGDNSSLARVTLGGGDETDGVVQQQVAASDTAPTIDSSAPLKQQAGLVADVPVGPAVPVSP